MKPITLIAFESSLLYLKYRMEESDYGASSYANGHDQRGMRDFAFINALEKSVIDRCCFSYTKCTSFIEARRDTNVNT